MVFPGGGQFYHLATAHEAADTAADAAIDGFLYWYTAYTVINRHFNCPIGRPCRFEEGARFLLSNFYIKPAASDFSQPLIFGLGHGIAEAFLVLIPALSLVSVPELGLAFFERILTIILHVTLTVVVWNGFQKNRRVLYLLIAILIHGLVDSLIPILSPLPNAIFLLEGALVVVDIIMVGYAWYSRKYYTGRNSNEKIGV